MASIGITRRGLLATGSLLAGGGAALVLPAIRRARAAATQTLTVGTNIPFTTLDPNTINTSVFPFRNSVFDPLIDILVTDIPSYNWGRSRTSSPAPTRSTRTIPRSA